MNRNLSRRALLRRSAAGLAGFWIAKDARIAWGYPANDKLRLASIGTANRARDNLDGVQGQELVALCDVDADYLGEALKRFPQAKGFKDFRVLLGEFAGKLDGVVVSTPDHLHAPATAMALRAKLPVYCEKPLAHSVHEVRTVTELARAAGVATQMGTQIHSMDNYRRVVELVRAGAIGAITEVHVWVGRSWAGGDRPKETPAVPTNLDWDLWLGPAPVRPYHSAYCPGSWRGWWDFGNGTLGDMACHHMDLPFWALELTTPESIESEGPPPHAESCPPWLIVRYQMKRKSGATVPLTWYHGEKRPPQFTNQQLPAEIAKQWGDGTLFVGTKGMLIADYDRRVLLPEASFKDFVAPAPTIAASPGHYEEWFGAIRDGKGSTKALCHFDYAGPLTEAVLLGAVAYRAGKKLAWDPAKFATGDAAADALLAREYRKGWTL